MNFPSGFLVVWLLLVVCDFSLPARADGAADTARCAPIKDDAERIACFAEPKPNDPAVDAVIRQMQEQQDQPAPTPVPPEPKKRAATNGDADLAACTEIENSVERLACFDNAAKARGAVSPERKMEAPADAGAWQVRIDQSKVDDSSNVFIAIVSDEMIKGRLDEGEFARLIVRCMENQTDVEIWIGGLWYSDRQPVTTRIDKQKAQNRSWIEGNDHEWMFHPNPIAFAKALMVGKELYVRTEPINEAPVEMTFKIAGLTNAIEPLKKACHWQ